jgi:UDP-N-acetylmuramoyl-L-alanyl-D-glutamate--2,6-diaminopimelate ligase
VSVPVARIAEALAREDLVQEVRGTLPDTVTGVSDDSRRLSAGALFIAVRGAVADGHEFLAAAAKAGAVAAIVERDVATALPAIHVRNGRRAAAVAGAAFHDWPGHSLRLVAVTGTSGKSTTVAMLRHLLDDPAQSSASIGTLGVLRGAAGVDVADIGGLTTPGPIELQGVLRALLDAGVQTVAMEVSSHALDQERVGAVTFDAAIFTNLSHEHLDYHGTMEAYLAAKAKLATMLAPNGGLVVNADEPAWRGLPSAARRITFGMHSPADVSAADVSYTPQGSRWMLTTPAGSAAVSLPLIGDFNVMNALGAAAAAWSLGRPVADIATRLAHIAQVPGRLERIWSRPTVLRDYAHKPDALTRALDAVRPFVERGRRIVTVVGCGGDRDRAKRPVMAAIAQARSELVILTSDNPRTEDPERILDEMEQGLRPDGAPHERIEDRRAAIARALDVADPGDVILLAGKGHETYQIRGTTRYPFDERAIVQELMATRRGVA